MNQLCNDEPALAAVSSANPLDLHGKVALVTGASRGIGTAIAAVLAEAGANVAVNYSGSEDSALELVASIQSKEGRAQAYRADVRDFGQVSEMTKRVVADMGGIDILVNNAGILLRSFCLMMPSEDFQRVMDVNLVGAFHCTKAAALHMMKRKSGVIVNISSLAGKRGLMGQAAYAASKAALESFTRVTAKEFARYRIRVNCIAPGCIDTGMMKEFSQQTETSYIQQIPMGRYGQADEVAKAVLFLASDLSSYTTGEILAVDGGMV